MLSAAPILEARLTTRNTASDRNRIAGHGLAAADGHHQGADDGQAARHSHVAINVEGAVRLAIRDEGLRGSGENVSWEVPRPILVLESS